MNTKYWYIALLLSTLLCRGYGFISHAWVLVFPLPTTQYQNTCDRKPYPLPNNVDNEFVTLMNIYTPVSNEVRGIYYLLCACLRPSVFNYMVPC